MSDALLDLNEMTKSVFYKAEENLNSIIDIWNNLFQKKDLVSTNSIIPESNKNCIVCKFYDSTLELKKVDGKNGIVNRITIYCSPNYSARDNSEWIKFELSNDGNTTKLILETKHKIRSFYPVSNFTFELNTKYPDPTEILRSYFKEIHNNFCNFLEKMETEFSKWKNQATNEE